MGHGVWVSYDWATWAGQSDSQERRQREKGVRLHLAGQAKEMHDNLSDKGRRSGERESEGPEGMGAIYLTCSPRFSSLLQSGLAWILLRLAEAYLFIT